MSDLISRQAALDICDTFNGQGSVWAVIKGYIKALPPVEQKQGEWEYVQYDANPNIGNWHCSECRFITPQKFRYCPFCGCKMCGGDSE